MSNPSASTSTGGTAADVASQILANNVIAGSDGPVLQTHQKKVAVFHGQTDKDSMNVLTTCQRTDAMKTAFGWSEEANFCNAMAALLGNAVIIETSWKVLDANGYRPTWTYLKKALLAHWGEVKDSRSYIVAMFSIRPQTNDMDNLDCSPATS